jgi:hypothetical protein
MSGGKSLNGRRRESRAWLGPPARGGERLARIFGISAPDRVDVGPRLEELQAAVRRLEAELRELEGGRADAGSGVARTGARGPLVELPRVPSATDRDFWLGHCEEFAVYTGDGPLGVVEGIRFQSRIDRPDLLEVRRGRLGRRTLLVPVEHVDLVDPKDRLVVLRASWPVSGRRRRLRSRLGRLRPLLH